MGNVARMGIMGGKPVNLASFDPYDRNVLSEDLLWRTLERAGVKLIAEHISRGDTLTEGEIEHLLRHVELPVLMKLTELAHFRAEMTPQKLNNHTSALIPIYVVSNRYSHLSGSKELQTEDLYAELEKYYQPGLHLYFGDIRIESFSDEGQSIYAKVKERFPGVIPVAPSFESIQRKLQTRYENESEEELLRKLLGFLEELKNEGFDTLHSVSSLDAFQLLCDRGISSVYRYTLDADAPIEEHIHHLFKLKNLVTKNVLCGWEISPGGLKKRNKVFLESDALRFLAVGCLTLRNVDWHILSSQFFSVEALQLSWRLGANCLGYGAVDENTARVLGIEMFQTLESLFGSDAGTPSRTSSPDGSLVFQ